MAKHHTDGIRKKNLGFRPEGKDPLHDAAYNIIAQLGRGTTDFIATAVVYYAQKQAAGDVDPAFRELLTSRQSHPKLLFIPDVTVSDGGFMPKPPSENPCETPATEQIDDRTNQPNTPSAPTQPCAASNLPDVEPMPGQNSIASDSSFITSTETSTKEMTTMTTTEKNLGNPQQSSNSVQGFLKRLAGGFNPENT